MVDETLDQEPDCPGGLGKASAARVALLGALAIAAIMAGLLVIWQSAQLGAAAGQNILPQLLAMRVLVGGAVLLWFGGNVVLSLGRWARHGSYRRDLWDRMLGRPRPGRQVGRADHAADYLQFPGVIVDMVKKKHDKHYTDGRSLAIVFGGDYSGEDD